MRLNPGHIDATLLLGEQMYRMKKYGEAVAHYKAIKTIPAANATRMYVGMAWACLGISQPAAARSAVALARKYAREDRDKHGVDRLVEYLDYLEKSENASLLAAS